MDFVNKIIDKKLHCIFISPHQDDAVLSCSGLLLRLVGKTKITVVNVFTSAHAKPYTLSARQFLKASGYKDALVLYKERKKEDEKVLSMFPVSVSNLNFEDALFRRKKKTFLGIFLPEFDHIYPTYRWHILKKIAKDDFIVSKLKKTLQTFNNKNTLIFAPYGIGNHVDHKIVRKVCEELFDNLILYSDFPYNIRTGDYGSAKKDQYILRLKPNSAKKNKFIKAYLTQFLGLFPAGKIPQHEEVYFINKII